MTDKKIKHCEFCMKLGEVEEGHFDHQICSRCYKQESKTINDHHKDVGYSCYCYMCM